MCTERRPVKYIYVEYIFNNSYRKIHEETITLEDAHNKPILIFTVFLNNLNEKLAFFSIEELSSYIQKILDLHSKKLDYYEIIDIIINDLEADSYSYIINSIYNKQKNINKTFIRLEVYSCKKLRKK